MKTILPLLIAILGLVGGAAGGWFLKPHGAGPACVDEHGVEQPPEACAPRVDEEALSEPTEEPPDAESASQFLEMERQFIVPLIEEGEVTSLVVMTLSLEVAPGHLEDVETRKPKLRDSLLRALFEHAYAGGFNGDFTAEYVMRDLRRALLKAARLTAGKHVRDVLIADVIRQDQ